MGADYRNPERRSGGIFMSDFQLSAFEPFPGVNVFLKKGSRCGRRPRKSGGFAREALRGLLREGCFRSKCGLP